jgi:adenylate cyclase
MNMQPEVKSAPQEAQPEAERNYKKLLLPAFLLILIQVLVIAGLFSQTEMSIYDSWFRLRGPQNPGEQIVVVAVDDSSLERIGPWAWPRKVHAQLLDKLSQARLVAFDFTFNSPQDAENDQIFAEAIAKHGRVVLSGKFYFEKDENGELVQGLQVPIEELIASQPSLGFVNMSTDADDTVRRCTLVDTNFADVPVPGLGLAVAMQAQGLSLEDLKLEKGFLYAGKNKIPINEQYQALPNFWGPMHTFKTIPYADIIEGKISPDYFKDKIVMVGPETAEDKDTYSTPCTTSNMVKKGAMPCPGVEIHATVAQSILTSHWFREVPARGTFLFLLVIAVITFWRFPDAAPGRSGGMLGTVALTRLQLLAWHYHWWLIWVPRCADNSYLRGGNSHRLDPGGDEPAQTKAMFSRMYHRCGGTAYGQPRSDGTGRKETGGNHHVCRHQGFYRFQ